MTDRHTPRMTALQEAVDSADSLRVIRLRPPVWSGIARLAVGVVCLCVATCLPAEDRGNEGFDGDRAANQPVGHTPPNRARGYRPWSGSSTRDDRHAPAQRTAPIRGYRRMPDEDDDRDRDQSLPTERLDRQRPAGYFEQLRGDDATREHGNASDRPGELHGYAPGQSRESHAAGLVADDGGPINELLLHYAVNSEPELGPVFNDLFRTLRPDIRLQICCTSEESVRAFVQRWGTAAVGQGRDVHVVNVNRPITVWARDRRICRQTPEGEPASTFVPTPHTTYDGEKQNDLMVQSLLWPTGLVPNIALTAFHLEGGNVVSNRRHIFIGANAFEDNQHRFQSESELFSEMSRLFGRTCVPIRAADGQVPWIHTDMYLTPIDTRTILVASPIEGCRLLPNMNTIPAMLRERPAELAFNVLEPGSRIQQRFDDVAEQLEHMGYEVIRVPALINVEKDWMVTFNNVVMDYQQGQRLVYLPRYNIPQLDEAAAQIYRALGFEVHQVDVSAIFHLGGTVRCLTNVTQRHPFEMRNSPRVGQTVGKLQVHDVNPLASKTRLSRLQPQPAQQREYPSMIRERDLPAGYGS